VLGVVGFIAGFVKNRNSSIDNLFIKFKLWL